MPDRVLVLGLDCAPPEIVFARRAELPTLSALMDRGAWGPLRSVTPPITVPAWMCMMTGKNPGRLGLYGFRHRKGNSYTDYQIPTSATVTEPAVWDLIGRAGKRSVVMGLPPTYPPKAIPGIWVCGFLTPPGVPQYTHPPELRREIDPLVGGEYPFDVKNFRTENRDEILADLNRMIEKHFAVAEHLMKTKPWDLFIHMEIGTDRLHHAFWKFHDPKHRAYEKGNRYERVVIDYYKKADAGIARLLEIAGPETAVLVVSDHGAKAMAGCIAVNDLLRQKGYLTLLEEPPKPGTELEKCKVDWSRTKAWGWGGYYARIFLNVKGRDPQGVIDPKDYESMRDEMKRVLGAVTDDQGRPLKNEVWRPEEVYGPDCRGDKPDLMAFFGDLAWRSAGTMGHPRVHLMENDTGPDDAMHDWDGIYAAVDPKGRIPQRENDRRSILDVSPTILKLMDVPIPKDVEGKSIF